MQLIIAGNEHQQARACAEIKGLSRDEWVYVCRDEEIRRYDLRGKTVLLFGTYKLDHMFTWRDLCRIVIARGGRLEEVLDGRLTGGSMRR